MTKHTHAPSKYIKEVLDHLESLEYRNLASGLDIKIVARTITGISYHCAMVGQSPMMAAITIWSATMNGFKQAMKETVMH